MLGFISSANRIPLEPKGKICLIVLNRVDFSVSILKAYDGISAPGQPGKDIPRKEQFERISQEVVKCVMRLRQGIPRLITILSADLVLKVNLYCILIRVGIGKVTELVFELDLLIFRQPVSSSKCMVLLKL